MAPKKVFCSHRSCDKAAVRDFAARLRERGIDAWFDEWEIQPGEDIVAGINKGLTEADVGLIFFSKSAASGRWMGAEVSSLIYRMIEDGRPLIPVMIDADAEVPELLRPRARRGIEELGQIVDAILGRAVKPPLGPAVAQARLRRFALRLEGPSESVGLDLTATLDGEEVAREPGVFVRPRLLTSYTAFLQGTLHGTRRGPEEAVRESLDRALATLGEELGAVVFAGKVGKSLEQALNGVGAGEELELVFETGSAELLALPFEAARLPDGRLPAVLPGVRVLRRPSWADTAPLEPLPGPLKILVAVGAPDEVQTRSAVLDLERELQLILDAVDDASRHGNAQVKILEAGHPTQIRKALSQDSYHVLHLSGHGRPGSIELEDEEGRAVPVTAEELAGELAASGRRLPLVFLSSCHGGTADSETVSFAQGLLQHGVPMVLSMQTRVTDFYAMRLASRFYRELATGELPFASWALAQARRTLELERGKALERGAGLEEIQPEYATASLFCAPTEGPILDPSRDRAPLRKPPVLRVEGPVPQLRVGDLIGRRAELRRILRVLRDDARMVAEVGRKAGAIITGMGGVGKSALAGRVMTRMREEGWVVSASEGRWSLEEVAARLGRALEGSKRDGLAQAGASLTDPHLDDRGRLLTIAALLKTHQVLLVLDNFEDNLTLGGGSFLDPTVEQWVSLLLQASEAGKLLVTCRYPVPGVAAYLQAIPLGPLSEAQTRKLFLRLPGFKDRSAAELHAVLHGIGGHPRMLEYLDGILRRGAGRLPAVTSRLRRQAEEAGVSLNRRVVDLEEGVQTTLLLGARDILLDELLTIVEEAGDAEALHQAAVSALPLTVPELARALAEGEPSEEQVEAAAHAAERLVETSLFTGLDEETVWVHRWTAGSLAERSAGDRHQERCRRAGELRMWRAEHVSHSLLDGMEAVRNFLEAGAFGRAAQVALGVAGAMARSGQLAGVAAFCSEVLLGLPTEHSAFGALADLEGEAHLALGFAGLALARYREVAVVYEQRLEKEPDRADYQRDLSVSYNKLGDLHVSLGEGEKAREYYEKSQSIRETLASREPDRADYQRDLSVSYNKLGNLHVSLGEGEKAREYYEKDLSIAETLGLVTK